MSDYRISGSFSSEELEFSGAFLASCRTYSKKPDEECESEEAIDEMAKIFSITLNYKNYYFDQEDFSSPSPVKSFFK